MPSPLTSIPRIQSTNTDDNDKLNQLKNIYNEYSLKSTAASDNGIDGAKFLRFLIDYDLLDQYFRREDVDLVFAKYKEYGVRYMRFQGFYHALTDIATRKAIDIDYLIENKVLGATPGSARPNSARTIAKPTRLHDDIRSYTGVHKAGGPTVIEDRKADLSDLLRRTGTGGLVI